MHPACMAARLRDGRLTLAACARAGPAGPSRLIDRHTGTVSSMLHALVASVALVQLCRVCFALLTVLVVCRSFDQVKRAETPVGDTLYAVCSIVMLSTPFLNLCKLLQSAGYEGSLAFKVSSILFVLTFVLCRVVALPAMLYWYNKRQREQQTEESTRDVKLEPEALHSDDDSSSKSADSQSVTASRTLPPLRPLCLGSNALLFALNLYWLRSAVRWSMRG